MKRNVAVVACLLPLASCTLMPEFLRPNPKKPQSSPEGYLTTGPTTKVDVSPGQSNLLEAIKEEKQVNLRLKQELDQIREENRRLNVRLASTEQNRDREHTARVAAEALHKDVNSKLMDRENRILNLALEKAKLEQELLLLRIAATERRLVELGDKGGAKAGPGR